jgi:hypothetical protein
MRCTISRENKGKVSRTVALAVKKQSMFYPLYTYRSLCWTLLDSGIALPFPKIYVATLANGS